MAAEGQNQPCLPLGVRFCLYSGGSSKKTTTEPELLYMAADLLNIPPLPPC